MLSDSGPYRYDSIIQLLRIYIHGTDLWKPFTYTELIVQETMLILFEFSDMVCYQAGNNHQEMVIQWSSRDRHGPPLHISIS